MSSSFSSEYVTSGQHAGMFKITTKDADGKETVEYMTRDQAFLAFCQRVADVNDEELKKVEEELQKLSDRAAQLTKLIQVMQTCRANKDSSHDDEGDKFKLDGYEDLGSKDIEQWFRYFGLGDTQDVNPNDKDSEWQNEWDQNITKAQGELDLVNNQVSQQMTEYDKYNNRMSKALDIAKSSLDQTASANQGVIGNM